MNRGLFSVSGDLRTVIVPFAYIVRTYALFDTSEGELAAEVVHRHLEENIPEFCEEVECLIFNPSKRWRESLVVLDARRLQAVFPNLKTVWHPENFEVSGADSEICVRSFCELEELGFASV